MKNILYILSRIGIFLFGNIALSVVSVTIITWVVNLFATVSSDKLKIKEVLFDGGGVWSLSAFILLSVLMFVLFYDDGKRHTAYEKYDIVFISITFLLMFAVFYVPVMFMDKTSGLVTEGFKGFYFPSKWLNEYFGLDYMLSALVTGIFPLLCGYVAYILSHKIYLKNHPVLDWHVKNQNADYSEEKLVEMINETKAKDIEQEKE